MYDVVCRQAISITLFRAWQAMSWGENEKLTDL